MALSLADMQYQDASGDAYVNGVVTATVTATAKVAAPAANDILAQLTLQPGVYRIDVTYAYTAGSPAAADVNNIGLRDATSAVSIAVPLLVPGALNIVQTHTFTYKVPVANSLVRLYAVGAATAGVEYNASISARLIGA